MQIDNIAGSSDTEVHELTNIPVAVVPTWAHTAATPLGTSAKARLSCVGSVVGDDAAGWPVRVSAITRPPRSSLDPLGEGHATDSLSSNQ
ncbi:hypothetical protein L6E12_28630 [Actinokineospora sp. PR83]|uniref:hypothetical protein n=1 Tax=Actinokineospora sp. PR83 TaxID=2884908 RepID=UPI001F4293B5|nr:hypothetical protein [Actinokineospora sp. PR83]MCG8919746.1 hypothetical protein [Actinokineospora sp. PR83]